LLAYLLLSSAERASRIRNLCDRGSGLAETLVEVEADDDLRAKLEIALLDGG
jgi:hypothetical protein